MSIRQRGLTLLELVIVVAILAAIAAAAINVTDDVDNQSRYDLTKTRAQQIHDAIVGPGGTLNGSPVVQGFVADMGRLPANLAELVEATVPNVYLASPFSNTNVVTYELPAYQAVTVATVTSTAQTWNLAGGAGWRGPYLKPDLNDPSLPSGAGFATFRDGWGNVGTSVAPTALPVAPVASTLDFYTPLSQDACNFGWRVLLPGENLENAHASLPASPTVVAGGLSWLGFPFTPDFFAVPSTTNPQPSNDNWVVASFGSDNALGTTTADFASTDYSMTLTPDDYLIRVSSWSGTVTLTSTPSPGNSQPASAFYHLALFYPTCAINGVTLSGTPNPQLGMGSACVLSQPLTLVSANTSTFGVLQSFSYTYSFTFAGPDPTNPTGTRDARIPIGIGTLMLVEEQPSTFTGATSIPDSFYRTSATVNPSAASAAALAVSGNACFADTSRTVFQSQASAGPITGVLVGNLNYQQPLPIALAPRSALPMTLAWTVTPQ